MSRRRYISTKISSDTRINRLAREAGDFAALLYTWMIPHAEDDATLPDDPEELLLIVMPGRRDRDAADVAAAVEAMVDLGLLIRCNGRLAFPGPAFYRYQTYISAARRGEEGDQPRETPPTPDPDTTAPQNAAEQRETPQNSAPRAHPRHSHSLSDSSSVSDSHSVGTGVPTSSAPARESSPAPPADTPYALWLALCETFGADESSLAPNEKKKQMAIAKGLLEQGYGEEKVRRCLAWLKSQEWRTSAIDLNTVRHEIGRWELNGMPTTAEPAAKPTRTTGHARDRPSKPTAAENTEAGLRSMFAKLGVDLDADTPRENGHAHPDRLHGDVLDADYHVAPSGADPGDRRATGRTLPGGTV